MAITSEDMRVAHLGNNSIVTPYPIPFYFLEDGDINVVTTDVLGIQSVLLPSQFVITGAGVPTGGSLTTTAAVPITSTVSIYRQTSVTQTYDYIEGDGFPAESHERALDKVTMQEQEGRDVDAHGFRLGQTYDSIPGLTPVNDSLLGLDLLGSPIFRTASEVLTWINLLVPVSNLTTKTWANNAERAIAVPDFIGQFGMQRDTMVTYMGFALIAGSWVPTTAAGLSDGSVTTPKLNDGVLSADAAGRAKMAAAFLMASHLNKDAVSGQTAKTFLEDADRLLGWSSADDALRSFAGNVAVPSGSVIQTVEATPYTANTNLAAPITADDTIPQIAADGVQILTLTITPKFADSKIRLVFNGFGARNAVGHWCAGLFRVPISNCLKGTATYSAAAGVMGEVNTDWTDTPATTAATQYTIRVGPGSQARYA